MNEKEIERTNLIDRFLDGHLTEEEMSRFKKQLEEDAVLRAELENYEISREAIRNYGLRNELRSIRSSMLQNKRISESEVRTVSIWQYGLRVAATILLIIVGFLAVQLATLSGEDLYKDKALPYPSGVNNTRSADEIMDPKTKDIQQSYAYRNYKESIRQYESLSDPSDTAIFIAGNAYLQSNQPEKAIKAFQKVIDINDQQGTDVLKDDAAYYLALSYLRAEEYDQAFNRFRKIKSSDSDYKQYVGNYFLIKLKMLDWMK